MPNINSLTKLVTKARDLRDHHRERHRPSGFSFALADSIDYLDAAHWNKVTANDSLFLSPRYLRILEDAGPENLRPCYALIFREKEPVAAVAAQSVTVRTALEPKARLGARPDPMRVWIRHRIPMLNLIVRGLLHTIDDHEEPPERNPFK